MQNLLLSLIVVVCLSAIPAGAAPSDDLLTSGVPGYPDGFTSQVFSGPLSTSSPTRKLHYFFMESKKGTDNPDPIILWLGGGPGCSALQGLLLEMGPYILLPNTPYNTGDQLQPNPFSWYNLTNLLFIDGPSGTGLSVNNESDYVYSDRATAKDLIVGVRELFRDKFPEYRGNKLYLAGEGYASKLAADLALQILALNVLQPDLMNLKGLLLGNPIMTFVNNALLKNQIDFIISHNMIDPKLVPYWQTVCQTDFKAASCVFFLAKYQQLLQRYDVANLYGDCEGGTVKSKTQQISQAININDGNETVQDELVNYQSNHIQQDQTLKVQDFLTKLVPTDLTNILSHSASKQAQRTVFQASPVPFSAPTGLCSTSTPINDYFTINAKTFHSNKKTFNNCNVTIFQSYAVNMGGNMEQLASLLQRGTLRITLYSGDWDATVPFTDTLNNIKLLGAKQLEPASPWKNNNQHIGFIRKYTQGLKFYVVKGAGQTVPQRKPEPAYRMLYSVLFDLTESVM